MRKLILFLILLFPLSGWGQETVLEKKISITFSDIPLEEALLRISKLTSTEFSYSDDQVPVQERVSLNAEDQPLKLILNSLLSNFELEYKYTNDRIIFRKAPAPLTQTVRGVVLDQHTHLPLPNVTILIAGTQPASGTTSDNSGKFKIPAVAVGRLTIQVTSVGYQSHTLSNILLGTGKELVLEINLTESIIAMPEVVVTASVNDTGLFSEAPPVSSRSFSAEETKRYAGSFGDQARMASGFAGVTSASDESNALIVRGNSPRGILWRVEGLEVPNPNHFGTEGSSNGIVSVLSPNVISNSRFLTGAFPAPYGNALSAVFDMELRSGNNERNEYSFQIGALGAEASVEGPLSGRHTSSYLVNYRYSTLNILDKLGVDLNDAGEYKNYQDLSFKIDLPSSTNGTLSVFGIGGLSKRNQQISNAQASDNADMGVAGVTYQKTVNEHTSFTTALSWSGTRISNYNETTGLTAGVLKTEESYTKSYTRASFLTERKLSESAFLKGGIIYSRLFYNFYLRNLDPGNQPYQEIINFRERDNTGITQSFITVQQNLSPEFVAMYGVHFIHFGLTKDYAIEPRAGIRWNAAPGKTFSVGYGKHSRIENLQYYLARDHQPGGNEIQINKDLGFTRANHYVAGYAQSLGNGHKLQVEVYYQQLYNAPVQSDLSSMYSVINEDAGFITDTLLNNGKGKNYGIEISMEKNFSKNFYYLVNASVYQSRFRIDNEAERNTSYNGAYNFHVLAGKEFKLRGNRDIIGINFKLTHAGGKRYIPIDLEKSIAGGRQIYDWENAFSPQLPAYFRSDLQLVYRRNKPRHAVEWRLDLQNVTNHLNAAYYYYNPSSQQISLKRQVGILPVFSYRIEF
jgi:hypothetical protein